MYVNKLKENVEYKTIDVIALGRAAIDLNANEINRPMEETMTFTKTVGGSPANIAVACRKLGLNTAFIGRVSDDQHGRFIRGYFEKLGIITETLVTDEPGSLSGLAFTEIKAPGDAGYLMYRSNVADLNLCPADVSEEQIRKSKILLISGTALSRSPSCEAVFTALDFARKHHTFIVFDIDYRNFTWTSLEETSIYYSLVAEKSDLVIGTREEFDALEARLPKSEREDAKTASRWMAFQPSMILIKHGKSGSKLYLENGEIIEGAVFPVIPLKTMGAGDSFAGGFLYGLLRHKSFYEATELGAGAAAIVVTKNSCSEAMPTLEEIEDFIHSYKNR